MKLEHEQRVRDHGKQIPVTEITGEFEVTGADADEVVGADLSSPTRLNGARFRVAGDRVGKVTGVRVDVGR